MQFLKLYNIEALAILGYYINALFNHTHFHLLFAHGIYMRMF